MNILSKLLILSYYIILEAKIVFKFGISLKIFLVVAKFLIKNSLSN